MFYRFALYGFLKNLKFYEPFIILYFLSVGITYAMIGVLVSVRMLSTTILELPTGICADAFGRRKSMVMSFLSYIASFSLFFVFRDFYIFAAAMVLYALGDAFRTGTHKAMILEYLRINGMQDRKVEYYGHTRAASQSGSAINAIIAAAIVFYTGNYALIFLVAMIPYAIDILNVGTYPPELDGISKRNKGMGRQLRDTVTAFAGIFRNIKALKGIINSSIFDGSFEVSSNYLQPILKSFAVSLPLFLFLSGNERTAAAVGATYFFIYVLTALASKNSDKVVKKIGKLPLAINATFAGGAFIILAAGIFTLAGKQKNSAIVLVSIALFVALYFIKNIRRPMNVGYISEQISHRTMASGLSAESLIKTLVAAALAPLVGWLADLYGIGVALAVLGALVMAFYPAARVK
ncbi:MAG: MFS transporter [Nitrospiraceae bacterium]|nr:MFS transporter [Nitrospiraceae bacterium]